MRAARYGGTYIMGDKSAQKKNYIIEKARAVFQKKGYRAVTMKDIVDACGISRGGLYLYFSSTKELFEAVIEQDKKDAKAIIDASRDGDTTPATLMFVYLNAQKKEILKKNNNLSAATFEYLFENKASKNDNPVIKRIRSDIEELEKLIIDGVEQEWIDCDNPQAAAKNLVYTIEGLKVTAQTSGLTADDLDKEIEYIMGTFGLVVE